MSSYLTDPLALAILFHVTYEKLAPQKGYETRTETRIFNPESANGKLMIATCEEIQKIIREEQKNSLNIGDMMRFSVELINEIKQLPYQMSPMVRVENIEMEPDGLKIVWISNI